MPHSGVSRSDPPLRLARRGAATRDQFSSRGAGVSRSTSQAGQNALGDTLIQPFFCVTRQGSRRVARHCRVRRCHFLPRLRTCLGRQRARLTGCQSSISRRARESDAPSLRARRTSYPASRRAHRGASPCIRPQQRILDRTHEFVRDAQTELFRGFDSFSRRPLPAAAPAGCISNHWAPRCSSTFTSTFAPALAGRTFPNLVVTRGFAQTSQVARGSVP